MMKTFISILLICLLMHSAAGKWLVPNEDDPMTRVWMGFPRSYNIWGDKELVKVQKQWSNLARTIAKYKPIQVLCDADLLSLAKKLVGESNNFPITYITTIPYDDIWLRDTGCVFRHDGKGGLECVKLNFNGWGNKQVWSKDKDVADGIAEYMKIKMAYTDVKGEGGGLITDGNGTLIANWASWHGHNRNPGKSREAVADELIYAYGAKKMIWFDGVIGKDITDDHIDCKLAFMGHGKLLLNWPKTGTDLQGEADEIRYKLSKMKDAANRKFQITKLPVPKTVRSTNPKMLKTYINYLVLDSKAVITTEFGDPETDADVRGILQKAYPGRTIEMLNMDSVYAGGGGIHCITQHEPVPRK